MRICPITPEWAHMYILEPYLQGCELVNLAWQGVDFHSLTKAPLSLMERVICWLTGVALLIPFINHIIWIVWQTFGRPEKLFDPYCPEIDPN